MSSVVVSFGISFRSADSIYKSNREFLLTTFSRVIQMIDSMLQKIPAGEQKELMQEFIELKKICGEEVEQYTAGSSSDWTNHIMKVFETLNQRALRLKKLIMLKEAELMNHQKRCDRLKMSIEALSAMFPEAEQQRIRQEIAAIAQMNIPEQETTLKKLSKKITKAAETIQVTETEIPVQAALKNIQPQKSAVLEDIETFIGDLILLDIPVTEEIQNLSEQAHASKLQSKQVLFYEQIKLTAARMQENAIMTLLYREELTEIASLAETFGIPETLTSEITALCAQETITESEYQKTALKAAQYIAQKIAGEQKAAAADMAAKIESGLKNLGYEVVDNESLVSGEPVFFASGDPDCRIMAKLSNTGELATRVVYESDDSESSAYSNEKSLDFAKKWCSDYDKLMKYLENNGIRLETLVRKEPEETPVTVIKKKKQHGTKKKSKTNTIKA